jgi:enoyl-CoA hydratase
MEFLLCADIVDARKAADMGLLNAVVQEDELLDTAFAYAARITKNAPLAVQATKRSVLEGLKVDMREAYRNESRISREVFATEDAKEGPRAFAEKRKPQWSGR